MTSTHFHVREGNVTFPHVFLDGEEHHHLNRVLRIKKGERVWLHDEAGRSYFAEVRDVTTEGTKLIILEERPEEEAEVRITLAQALIKAKKMDFLVQKATELGIFSLIPVVAERSVVKIKAAEEAKKVWRWQKIAREAAKQSRRSSIPRILPLQPFRRLIKEQKADRRLLLSERQGRYLRDILPQAPARLERAAPPTVIVLVGPEGGWTENEETGALGCGYEAASLGKRILRSETAALAALALVSHYWNT